MPRIKRRKIQSCPRSNYFKPVGIKIRDIETNVLSFDELEAVRLKDLLGIDQKEAAVQIGVSQSTFHRIIVEARKKIADALIKGKAIKIEGGNFIMEEKNIKIAISSLSENIDGDIDSRFGRCPFFLFVTLNDGEVSDVKAIENSNKDIRGGAGVAVAEMVANQNVNAVITGNVGPRALEVLNQFKIDIYQSSGSIKEAIKQFIEKKLIKLNG
jgi:predicted DNA-binding protein (UPF0251 family)/predicted Fe-Mo cluster-binding NifX family protein